jgi:predicted CXXCH cytochrome family protein
MTAIMGLLWAITLAVATTGAAGSASLLGRTAVVAQPAGCTAKGCHAPLVKDMTVHAIVADEGCEGSCHKGSAPDAGVTARCKSGKVFKLEAAQPDLCLGCHSVKKATPLHAAVDAGGCTACHDPHGSKLPKLLKSRPPKLCRECHEGKGTGKFQHSATSGDCTDCHDPHSGVAAPLLKKPLVETCSQCHDLSKAMKTARTVHAPVTTGPCTTCHDPHGTDVPRLLKDKPNQLCLRCHDAATTAKDAAAKRVSVATPSRHQAIEGGSCLDCHRGHSSSYQRLLTKPQPTLCYGCHERQDKQPVVHSALLLGKCSTCHDPHGGKRKGLMRFASTNEMCFACHADDLTGRSFIHNPVSGGCDACHGAHGGTAPNLLRAEGKAVCYECHSPVDEGKYKHAVLEKQGCVACHDPHATANRSYLPKPVNEVCITCHPKQADGRHVPGVNRAQGHIVAGPNDPVRQTRSFSCASCHNPHSSGFPKLLYQGGGGMAVCARCHFTGANPSAALPRVGPPVGNLPVTPQSSTSSASTHP